MIFPFIFGCAGSRCCVPAFSRCGQWGRCSRVAKLGLLTAVASLVAERGLQGAQARVAAARGLSSPGAQVQQPLRTFCSQMVGRTRVPCVARWILHRWTTSDVPWRFLIMDLSSH